VRAPLDSWSHGAMWPSASPKGCALAPLLHTSSGSYGSWHRPMANNVTNPVPNIAIRPRVLWLRLHAVVTARPNSRTIVGLKRLPFSWSYLLTVGSRAGDKPRPFFCSFEPLTNFIYIFRQIHNKHYPRATWLAHPVKSLPTGRSRVRPPGETKTIFYNINQQPMMQRHVVARDWATCHFKNQSEHAMCQHVIRPCLPPRRLCRTATCPAVSACRTPCQPTMSLDDVSLPRVTL
jgi:hypothetical protein